MSYKNRIKKYVKDYLSAQNKISSKRGIKNSILNRYIFICSKQGFELLQSIEQNKFNESKDTPFLRIKLWIGNKYSLLKLFIDILNLNFKEWENFVVFNWIPSPKCIHNKNGYSNSWLLSGQCSTFEYNQANIFLRLNKERNSISVLWANRE